MPGGVLQPGAWTGGGGLRLPGGGGRLLSGGPGRVAWAGGGLSVLGPGLHGGGRRWHVVLCGNDNATGHNDSTFPELLEPFVTLGPAAARTLTRHWVESSAAAACTCASAVEACIAVVVTSGSGAAVKRLEALGGGGRVVVAGDGSMSMLMISAILDRALLPQNSTALCG